MSYRLLADGVIVLHFLFVLFVVGGGLLLFRWPKVIWFHLPCVAWGVAVEIGGWICPLTSLENEWRQMSQDSGYVTSFVEHYLLPPLYPELWFPGGVPSGGFFWLGLGVLVINGVIYRRFWRRRAESKGLVADGRF